MHSGISAYLSRIRQFTPNARKFLAFQFFLSVNTGIYGVLFNLYLMRLGYGEDFLGLLLSVVYLSSGLTALPIAIISDRIGRRKTLMAASCLLALGLAFLYTIASSWTLILASILYGIATGAIAVASSPFMAENSSGEERIHLFSMNAIVNMVSMIVGSLAGGILPGLAMSALGLDMESVLPYRYTLYLSLAAVLITLLPLLLIREKDPAVLNRLERLRLVTQVIRTPNVQKLVIVNVLIGTGAGLIVPFFNVYFHKVLSASTDQIGVIFSIGQVVMVVGLLTIPMLTARIGKVRTIALTQLFSIPFLIMIALTMNLYIAAFAYIMRMMLMNMANPAISSFNMEIVLEKERATVSSLTQMGWYLFYALSTYFSGIMMSQGNYLLPFLITCVVYFIAAVAYYVFFLRIESAAAESHTTA